MLVNRFLGIEGKETLGFFLLGQLGQTFSHSIFKTIPETFPAHVRIENRKRIQIPVRSL